MDCGRDDAQDDLAFRDYGVNDHRTEDAVVLTQVNDQVRSLGDAALQENGRHGRIGHADLEAVLFEAALQHAYDLPEFLLVFGVVADQLQAFQGTDNHRHRERLGVKLRTHVVTQQVDQPAGAADECTDTGHRLGKGVEQHVYAVHYAEMRRRTAAALTHRTEAVGIVDQKAELEILFQGHDLVELAQVAFHAEDTLGDHEHAAVLLFGQVGGMLQLQAQRLHVVVAVYETLALVQAQAVDDAGMRFGIVDHHVARRQQAVDDRNHALITEVQQEGVLLADELGQFALETLVVDGLAAHHAGAHRGRHAELCGTLGVGLADFGVVGQPEVIVQTPVEHLLAPESHVGADIAFQFGERVITVGVRHVLTDGATCIFLQACKNINHKIL